MNDGKSQSLTVFLSILRRKLMVAAVSLVIGMGISWNFSTEILNFVERPLTGETYLTDLKRGTNRVVRERFPGLYGHFGLDREPVPAVRDRRLNYSTPLEPFFIQCKISLIAGFLLSLPVALYLLWQLLTPRLDFDAKRYVLFFVLFGTVSFCVGALFFLMLIWPVVINFSLSYESEGLQSWFNLSRCVDFCLRLILVFGLMFELPVISLLLARLGIVTYSLLARNRKYAFLACAVIAAFHADLITMFVVMAPLYLMYEASVWTALLFGRRKVAATCA